MLDSIMLSGDISKIATQSAGGWKISINVPESMAEAVRPLLGSENTVLFNITFDMISELEIPKRGPGRPKTEGALVEV